MPSTLSKEKLDRLDFSKLERDFKDAIAVLPTYKRTVAYEYIQALQSKIVVLGNEIEELASHLAQRKADSPPQYPPFVALRNPDGTATRRDLLEMFNLTVPASTSDFDRKRLLAMFTKILNQS